MAQAKVVKEINAPAAAVWEQLGNFASVKAGGPVESVTYEGEGVGMVRTIVMGGGAVVEKLQIHDAEKRTFTYAITNEDCPLPFQNYSATVNVVDNGNNTSTVDWTGTFDPKGVDEDAAVKVATGIYAGAIKGARIALGVD